MTAEEETLPPLIAADDERKIYAPPRKLGQAIKLQDVNSDGGCIFDIVEPQADDSEAPYQDPEQFDPSQLPDLNLAAHGCEDEGDLDREDEAPFEKLARKMISLTADGGVKKMVLTQGTGLTVPQDALVSVHYNGFFEYADEPFDSSRLRNSVQKFRLSSGELIYGFDIAVASMKKNELSRFIMKPEYAYGEKGAPPRIPPDSTAMFEIELLDFVENADSFYSLTYEERKNATFDIRLKAIELDRKTGNSLFNKQQFRRAASKFSKAISLLEDSRLRDDEEETRWKKLLVKLYNNMALTMVRLGRYRNVLYYTGRALDRDSLNTKAHYYRGKAYRLLMDFPKAKSSLSKSLRNNPNCKEIKNEIKLLDKDMAKLKISEVTSCQRMFGTYKKDADIQSTNKNLNEELTDEFKTLVENTIKEFCESSGENMPFPGKKYTEAEQKFITDTAKSFNLNPLPVGEGENYHIRVEKKSDD